jgi:hypothetical protein
MQKKLVNVEEVFNPTKAPFSHTALVGSRGIYIFREVAMDLSCHKCGFTADHGEFRFLCKTG